MTNSTLKSKMPKPQIPNLKSEIASGKITPTMSFNQKVWAITARIPRGRVITYGDIARILGTRAYRAVGNALNKNPYSPKVPCHRVVGSTGQLTGFAGGLAKKQRMLKSEGVTISNGKVARSHFAEIS
jgi:methylated-DNA-[protein]-cysteine S-methyltransferase